MKIRCKQGVDTIVQHRRHSNYTGVAPPIGLSPSPSIASPYTDCSPHTAFTPWRGQEGQKKCPSLACPLLPVDQLVQACAITKSRNLQHQHRFFQVSTFPISTIAIVPTAEIYNHVGCTTPQPQGRVPSASKQIPPADKWPCSLLTPLSQRRGEALKVNISAGEGLQDVLKSNLGPRGTIKM